MSWALLKHGCRGSRAASEKVAGGIELLANGIGDLAAKLESLLKLRSIPFGMKLFERRADMEAIPKIRRPKFVHTLDQVVAQALTTFQRIMGVRRDTQLHLVEHRDSSIPHNYPRIIPQPGTAQRNAA